MVAERRGSPAVPFGGVVGQADLKEALLAVGAHPDLDGVLVQGEKGTAKSTAVRGLAALLPDQRAIEDCPYGCPPDDPDRQCPDCRERDDPEVTTRSVPFVTLPLGATRDRVVGSLSVADALDGDPTFEPGLLARANRGILYVDEVNLLDDHLVDLILDAAASGLNRVERDGVSVTHPAEFTLVGTMNPEEGDLRPQLRDRFALSVTVSGSDDIEERLAVLDRALGEATEDGYGAPAERTAAARERLVTGQELLDDVSLSHDQKRRIVDLCRTAGVDGHRADIAIARTARALAALDGRPTVIDGDVRRAAMFALPHRLRTDPFEDGGDAESIIDEALEDTPEDREAPDGEQDDGDASTGGEQSGDRSADEDRPGETGDASPSDEGGASDTTEQESDADSSDGPGPSPEIGPESSGRSEADGRPEAPEGPSDSAERPNEQSDDDGMNEQSDGIEATGVDGDGSRHGDGRAENGAQGSEEHGDGSGTADPTDGNDAERSATPIVPGSRPAPDPESVETPTLDLPSEGAETGDGTRSGSQGRDGDGPRVRTERSDDDGRIDPAASVRAAAQRGRDAVGQRDLRQSVRSTTGSALVVVAVDASASMRGPMRTAKGAVLSLLRDAYERRDEVAVVAFAGTDAEVVLPPTDSVSMAARHLKDLPAADRTPLPAGIDATASVIDRAAPEASVAVVVTDGRATAGTDSPTADTRHAAERLGSVADRVLVVDAGDRDRSLVGDVVSAAGADRLPLSALSADALDRAVGDVQR